MVRETGLVRRGRVVEVDVEEELVLRVGKPLAELALDGSVAGADVVLEDFADDEAHVLDLAELRRGPVVQQLGAFVEYGAEKPRRARVLSIVESAGVEPEAVDCAAELVALGICEEAPGGEVCAPPFEGVDVGPFVGDAADVQDLGYQGEGYWHAAWDVCWLGRIVCEKLD